MYITDSDAVVRMSNLKMSNIDSRFFYTGECIRTNVSIKSLCPIKINVDVSVLKGRENFDSGL